METQQLSMMLEGALWEEHLVTPMSEEEPIEKWLEKAYWDAVGRKDKVLQQIYQDALKALIPPFDFKPKEGPDGRIT